jgi:hypothetical protein
VARPPRRRRDPKLQRFLLEGERVVVDVRQHWFVIARPVAFTLIALFFVMWVDARIRVDAGMVARVLWFAWFILLGWMGFQIAQWRHDRFIATDKRLLMYYGLITQKIAMMPFIKVTDMSYKRTVSGRIFGYGKFILESAGQDQALRTVDWVPHPDTTYRIICAEIFGLAHSQKVADPDRDDGFIEDDPGGSAVSRALRVVNPLGRSGGTSGSATSGTSRASRSTPVRTANHSPIEEHYSHSRAIPLHERGIPAPIDPRVQTLYSSEDERRRRRMADTGPLPLPPERDPAADD